MLAIAKATKTVKDFKNRIQKINQKEKIIDEASLQIVLEEMAEFEKQDNGICLAFWNILTLDICKNREKDNNPFYLFFSFFLIYHIIKNSFSSQQLGKEMLKGYISCPFPRFLWQMERMLPKCDGRIPAETYQKLIKVLSLYCERDSYVSGN